MDDAVALLKEQERICRQLGNLEGLQASLGNQAAILYARGELDDAMPLMKEQERICRQLGNLNGLQRSLENQAAVLKASGRLDDAEPLLKERERICPQPGNSDGLVPSFIEGVLLGHTQKLPEALRKAEEAYQFASSIGDAALAAKIEPILSEIRKAMERSEK